MAKLRCMGCMREYDEKKKKCPYCGYTRQTTMEYTCALCPETVLQARYVVGKVLRFGEQEIIYLGWDQVLDKRIAIKEYYPQSILERREGQKQVGLRDPDKEAEFQTGKAQYISDARELARFREETGIIRIYDYFEQNETVYVITEYSENYQQLDIATRMLYQKADKKRRRHVWQITCGIEVAAGIVLVLFALVLWRRPYAFTPPDGSAGMQMPDVTGESFEQARQELEDMGLSVVRKERSLSGVSEGIVVAQSEVTGAAVTREQAITLQVADGTRTDPTTEEGTHEPMTTEQTSSEAAAAISPKSQKSTTNTTEAATTRAKKKKSSKQETTTEVIVIED